LGFKWLEIRTCSGLRHPFPAWNTPRRTIYVERRPLLASLSLNIHRTFSSQLAYKRPGTPPMGRNPALSAVAPLHTCQAPLFHALSARFPVVPINPI